MANIVKKIRDVAQATKKNVIEDASALKIEVNPRLKPLLSIVMAVSKVVYIIFILALIQPIKQKALKPLLEMLLNPKAYTDILKMFHFLESKINESSFLKSIDFNILEIILFVVAAILSYFLATLTKTTVELLFDNVVDTTNSKTYSFFNISFTRNIMKIKGTLVFIAISCLLLEINVLSHSIISDEQTKLEKEFESQKTNADEVLKMQLDLKKFEANNTIESIKKNNEAITRYQTKIHSIEDKRKRTHKDSIELQDYKNRVVVLEKQNLAYQNSIAAIDSLDSKVSNHGAQIKTDFENKKSWLELKGKTYAGVFFILMLVVRIVIMNISLRENIVYTESQIVKYISMRVSEIQIAAPAESASFYETANKGTLKQVSNNSIKVTDVANPTGNSAPITDPSDSADTSDSADPSDPVDDSQVVHSNTQTLKEQTNTQQTNTQQTNNPITQTNVNPPIKNPLSKDQKNTLFRQVINEIGSSKHKDFLEDFTKGRYWILLTIDYFYRGGCTLQNKSGGSTFYLKGTHALIPASENLFAEVISKEIKQTDKYEYPPDTIRTGLFPIIKKILKQSNLV